MPAQFRVLTYNVRSLRDDAAAVAAVVRACDPDVVFLQEAPRFCRWRSKLAKLARECGLLYVTGGRTTGGVALLANLRVDVTTCARACSPSTRGCTSEASPPPSWLAPASACSWPARTWA